MEHVTQIDELHDESHIKTSNSEQVFKQKRIDFLQEANRLKRMHSELEPNADRCDSFNTVIDGAMHFFRNKYDKMQDDL